VSNDVIFAEIRKKSQKPDQLYHIIERMFPGARKIELFGRNHNIRRSTLISTFSLFSLFFSALLTLTKELHCLIIFHFWVTFLIKSFVLYFLFCDLQHGWLWAINWASITTGITISFNVIVVHRLLEWETSGLLFLFFHLSSISLV
jgi:hypothetical protein